MNELEIAKWAQSGMDSIQFKLKEALSQKSDITKGYQLGEVKRELDSLILEVGEMIEEQSQEAEYFDDGNSDTHIP